MMLYILWRCPTGAKAQAPPILLGEDVYTPPIVYCTNPDILDVDNVTVLMSQCDGRSNGCNLDKFRCILGAAVNNVNASAAIIDFDNTAYGEWYPGKRDGKIRSIVSFPMNPLFGPRGFVQVWKLRTGTSNVFDFTLRQRYVDTGFAPSSELLFHELAAGVYVLVYWDVGGTRNGDGRPEISNRITITNVATRNYFTRLEHIPDTGPPSNRRFTNVNLSHRHFISHRLTGLDGFLMPHLNAEMHNRRVMFELRTDQGNVIMAHGRQPPLPFDFAATDEPFFMKTTPLTCCNKAMLVQARLAYVGLPHSTFASYWTDRQRYGYGTVMARRLIKMTRTVVPGYDLAGAIAMNNIASDDDSDTMNIHLVTRLGPVHDPGLGQQGLESFTGDLNVYEDYFGDFEFSGEGVIEGRQYRIHPQFKQHTNSYFELLAPLGDTTTEIVANDYSCQPTGSEYAKFWSEISEYEDAGQAEYADRYQRTTFADIEWDMSTMVSFFGLGLSAFGLESHCGCGTGLPDCECRICDGGTGFNCPNQMGLFESGSCSNLCDQSDRNFYEYYGTSPYMVHDIMGRGHIKGRTIANNGGFPCADEGADLCIRGLVPGWRAGVTRFGYLSACNGAVPACLPGGCGVWMPTGAPPNPDNVFPIGGPSTFAGPNVNQHTVPFLQYTYEYDDKLTYIKAGQQGFPTPLRRAVVFNSEPNHIKTPKGTCVQVSGDTTPTDLGGGFGLREPTDEADFFFDTTNTGVFDNIRRWGAFGPDVQSVTLMTRMGGAEPYSGADSGGQLRFHIAAIGFAYARFKVFPEVEFLQFEKAQRSPDTIDVRFRLSCPLVEHGLMPDGVGGADAAFCADVWRVTNQNDDVILVDIIEGGARMHPAAALGRDGLGDAFIGAVDEYARSDDLQEVLTETEMVVRIQYNQGDRLSWCFLPRLEPEVPRSTSFCKRCLLDIPVPPKQYTLLPMIASVNTPQPACEYNSPEMLLTALRGEFFAYPGLIATDANDQIALGIVLDNPRYSHYYEVWNIGGDVIEGFSEEFQAFSAGATVRVYDQRDGLLITDIREVDLPALFPNPLIRPQRCISTANATCPVEFMDDPSVSGINQFHQCSISNTNEVILQPRTVFAPGFGTQNIGAVYFNRTTEYVDVFIQEQREFGIDQMDMAFLVEETGFYTLSYRYGRTIDVVLEAPCFERLIDFVVVLTSFQIDPQSLIRIPGCARADNCCYQLPLAIRGNTPNNTDIVNLDTCIGTFDACEYEILVSPMPSMPEIGLCLGTTYQFTVQSPQALVDARTPPVLGQPWRCPAVATIAIPQEGFSPIDILILPGPCNNPGARVEFEVRYTNPVCSGPISLANADADCRFELVFALELISGQPFLGFVPGADPDNGGGFVIDGNITFPYNTPTRFIFPEMFPPNPDATLENGQWQVTFWLRPASAPSLKPDEVEDARQVVMADFIALQEDANGLSIVRTAVTRPQCPATFDDAEPEAITVEFTVRDLTFEGPYILRFLTPSGAPLSVDFVDDGDVITCGVTNCTVDADLYCSGVCPPGESVCDACNIKMRDQGISAVGRIGTGVFSPQESGAYQVLAESASSTCNATYFEFIDSLETFRVQTQCYDTLCPGGLEGRVETYTTGGTKIPFEDQRLALGTRFELYKPQYNFSWVRPDGVSSLPTLTFVPQGFYQVNVTDFNGCVVQSNCTVGSVSDPMLLEVVNVKEPVCANGPAELVFQVTNGTAPYTLVKVGPEQAPVNETSNGVVLTDTTVIPNETFLYVVVDANRCRSPVLPFRVNSTATLSVTVVATQRPCAAGDFTGSLMAIVEGNSGGEVTIEWFFNNNPTPFASGPLFTLNVISGRQAGIYRARVSTFLNCTASSTLSLNPVDDLEVRVERTGEDVIDGFIRVQVFGGNGPAFTLSVQPPDELLVALQPVGDSLFADITNVNPGWNGFIRARDRVGCIKEVFSEGTGTPIDIEFETPTPTPSLFPPSEREKDLNDPGLFWIMFGMIGAFFLCAGFMYIIPSRHVELVYDRASPPPSPRPTEDTPLLN